MFNSLKEIPEDLVKDCNQKAMDFWDIKAECIQNFVIKICNDMVTLSKVGVLEKYYNLCDNIPNEFVMDKEWHNDIINLLEYKLKKGHFNVKIVNDCNLYISWCASY